MLVSYQENKWNLKKGSTRYRIKGPRKGDFNFSLQLSKYHSKAAARAVAIHRDNDKETSQIVRAY